jgi:gluconolactonase
MKRTALVIVVCCAVFQAAHAAARAQALQAPAVAGAAADIPGVVKGGTPIERILTGYDGLDDLIRLTDGTLVFSETGGAPAAPDEHADERGVGARRGLERIARRDRGRARPSHFRASVGRIDENRRHLSAGEPRGAGRHLRGEAVQPAQRSDRCQERRRVLHHPGLTVQQAEALVKRLGKPLEPRLPPAVYYIPPGERAIRIEDRMIRPNGIQLSRDEKTLYVSDSNGSDIIAWDIQPDGLVRNRRAVGSLTGRSTRDNGLGGIRTFADGMTIDNDGRIYVATGGGVEVLSEQGRHLGTIPVRCPPGRLPEPRVRGAGKEDAVCRRRRLSVQG